MYSKAEASQIRRQFWIQFDEYSRSYLGKHGKWMTYNTGVKDLVLKFNISRTQANVMMAVESRNEDLRFDIFCKLHECELVLNGFLGEGWIWDEMHILENGKPVCALYKQIEDVDIYDQECWEKVHHFFAEEMTRLEKALVEIRPFFEDYVKRIIAEQR
ncbi:MAG: DUF4268 domain-containing protein [Bacteroidales bacterium]|nr:DUF4268 domain-containing protein [Bacteroidales bacterium]